MRRYSNAENVSGVFPCTDLVRFYDALQLGITCLEERTSLTKKIQDCYSGLLLWNVPKSIMSYNLYLIVVFRTVHLDMNISSADSGMNNT